MRNFLKRESKMTEWTFLGLLLLSLMLPASARAADPCGTVAEITLLAGQTIDVGNVFVSNDAQLLYVTYHTEGGWQITETHLDVATSFSALHQTKKGNPIPGQFPYHSTHNPGVDEVEHTIDLSSWPAGTTLYIAAHAIVVSGGSNETAWGDGLDFPGNNWATYFTYVVQPCVEPPKPGILEFGNAQFSVQETGVKALIEILREEGSDGQVSVDFSTADISATAGEDYESTFITVSFAPGETQKFVEIPILDDLIQEGDEMVQLTLSNVIGAALGEQNTATLTIIDNDTTPPDPGVLQFSDPLYIFDEGNENHDVVITVTRQNGSFGPVSVDYTITEDTALEGVDFEANLSGTLFFADGETGKAITITIIGDIIHEEDKSFFITLSNVIGATLGTPNTATAQIVDDDPIIPE